MKKIVHISVLLAAIVLSFACFAKGHGDPTLTKVSFPVSVEGWVSTQTAKVIVSVNLSLREQGLAVARQDILNNLKRIAKGDWQITQFNRSQDSSGLQTLSVLAEIRLPNTKLTHLKSEAKRVSQPGATYQIKTMDFNPSMADVEQTRSQLREVVYTEANAEVARLNKAFPQKQFSLYRIKFFPPGVLPSMARPKMLRALVMPEPMPGMSVSNRVRMNAMIVLGSDDAKSE